MSVLLWGGEGGGGGVLRLWHIQHLAGLAGIFSHLAAFSTFKPSMIARAQQERKRGRDGKSPASSRGTVLGLSGKRGAEEHPCVIGEENEWE